ncbi:MAG TPA: isochorismatase family cysteine hydrolase [Baekduia sp.]|nr:isochorismatase family cysteine hydrolase [Baekduia sp.]
MPETLAVPEIPHTDRVALDPATTVLVVVDMQHDFVSDGGSLQVPDAAATVPTIAELVRRFRVAGSRIVFTQDTHRDGDPEFAIWPPHAIEGTRGHAIVDELRPLPGDTVLRKPRYDAFYGTPLDHLLRQWRTTTLVICGTVANICVHYTASSAALRWYDVVIPRDAISALDPFDLAASLRQTTSLLAGRVSTAVGIELAS